MAAAEEAAATQPAQAAAEAVVVAVGQAEVGEGADRAGVARVVNSVKADLRAADPEAANVFEVENGFAAERDFATENDFEITARGAVTAAASGTEGGTRTA